MNENDGMTEILAAMRGTFGGVETHGGLRRQSERLAYNAPLVIEPVEQEITDEPVTVMLKNYSAGGLGIVHTRALRRGSQFLVHFDRAEGPVTVLCTIVHGSRREDGFFEMGAAFTRVLNHEQPHEPAQPLQLGWVRESLAA